jgi:mono/diheme cytochrome c family protein
MTDFPRSSALLASLLFAIVSAAGASAPKAKVGYNELVQPILAENCFNCHGPDSASRKGKLRLDRFEFATKARGDGDLPPAIVPGDPARSPLIERIKSRDAEEMMPPPETHKRLRPDEVALLERWITEGAAYEEHWSLIAPKAPAIPEAPLARGWARNPIDAFVAQRLGAEGLKPSPEEKAPRLLRRAALDITGLPPSPAEIAAFEADRAPGAYERAVDRLLAGDAAAEHSARLWLDAVRYADTHGIHIDNYRTIWPYRDWVVDAFRRNQPFDQFTVEQVAGDLLPGATLEQRVASGFNRCLSTTSEGGAIAEEYEAIYAKDRVETLSTVWLGLTTGCASCHDHKFDPVSQRDFYSLAAFFRNNTMPAMDGNRFDTPPTLFVPSPTDRSSWQDLQARIGGIRSRMEARSKEADADFDAWLAAGPALASPPINRTVIRYDALIGGGGETDSAAGDGPYGPPVRLDGRDRVVGDAVPWLRGESSSAGMFVFADGKANGPLISCRAEGENGVGWEVFLEEGKIGLHIADGTGRVKVRNVGLALPTGQWSHVLVAFDTASVRSRTVEVFVGGKMAVNSTVSAFLPTDIRPQVPLRLGSRAAAAGAAPVFLSGAGVWAQDFRVYTRGFQADDLKPFSAELEAMAALKLPPEKRTAAQKRALRAHFLSAADLPSLALARELDPFLAREDALRSRGGLTLVMEEKKDSEPFAHVLNRGEYNQPGEKVPAAVPGVLPPLPADAPRNRLGLARWLVAPENPLTARVTVNRLWQQFFGAGLVESTGDFGVTGTRPSHPELLDWLALRFRDSGWDQRAMARLMVTSATYRQSAAAAPALLEKDPANRLLARGPRHRLDAEQLRDQALAASGLLVRRLGGRPVRPYQPEGIWEDVAMKESTTRFYQPDHGENLYRRSLYTLWKRTAPPPAMDILNAPSREVSCVRRDRTNTPLQALVTLNDPIFVESSRQLAAQALAGARSTEARIDFITLRLLGRRFSADERAVARRTLDAALAVYGRDTAAAAKLLAVGESPVPGGLPAPEVAAWTLVASKILNLDESLTK